ncbi:MAG TPA: hypothetical protein ENI87_08320 [bacterium]|nr:hypothetical protein [bacterium]
MQKLALLLALIPASLATPILAQERFRASFGIAGGSFEFDESGASPRRDDAGAGLARIEVEGFARRGFGAGIRLEALRSDDDLFQGVTGSRVQATQSHLFAHVGYQIREHRFRMPMRFGVRVENLNLDEEFSNFTYAQTDYTSIGPYFEIEPEVTLVHRGRLRLAAFGRFGIGGGGTVIEIDGDAREWDSSTAWAGIEVGLRLRYGRVEFQANYIGRWTSMDRSDPEGGAVIPAYDAGYDGLFFGFGIVF